MNERLKSALYSGTPTQEAEIPSGALDSEDAALSDVTRDTEVETTFVGRDAKSYFAVILDDNNRRPIARLHFNGKARKYLGTFDVYKTETRHLIESLDDIYLHAEAIREAVRIGMGDGFKNP